MHPESSLINPIFQNYYSKKIDLLDRLGKFYCPVRDANIDTPNAVCNICLAEQLDF